MNNESKRKNNKERVCQDFYPNCQYCSYYSACFPADEKHESLGRALVVEK